MINLIAELEINKYDSNWKTVQAKAYNAGIDFAISRIKEHIADDEITSPRLSVIDAMKILGKTTRDGLTVKEYQKAVSMMGTQEKSGNG